MSLTTDSASVKEHNRVKSVLKSGEDPSSSVLFSQPQPKEAPLYSGVPSTHSGVCQLFMVQNEAGKGMWLYEVQDMKRFTEAQWKRIVFVCVQLVERLTFIFFNNNKVQSGL